MIIGMNDLRTGLIDVNALRVSENRRLDSGLIAPANEQSDCLLAPEHAAEPIKSMNDIFKISEYLIKNKRYRDNMLFIVGINFGLRVSDLRMLRFSNLIRTALRCMRRRQGIQESAGRTDTLLLTTLL